MSFGTSSAATGLTLKKFESQTEVDDKKKRRQEEWEEVRKPDDPIECPEAPVDNRCLYDKLEEQRLTKQEEFDDKMAFKNQVKRLDEDETKFLDFVTERQHEITKARNQEETDIILEMKDARVVTIPVSESKPAEKKGKPVTVQRPANKRSQMALLAGAVKRKVTDDVSPNKMAKTEVSSSAATESIQSTSTLRSEDTTTIKESLASMDTSTSNTDTSSSNTTQKKRTKQVATVIGIRPSFLPGLKDYSDSSDSMSSSSDSEPDFSLASRNTIGMIKQHVAQIQQKNQ